MWKSSQDWCQTSSLALHTHTCTPQTHENGGRRKARISHPWGHPYFLGENWMGFSLSDKEKESVTSRTLIALVLFPVSSVASHCCWLLPWKSLNLWPFIFSHWHLLIITLHAILPVKVSSSVVFSLVTRLYSRHYNFRILILKRNSSLSHPVLLLVCIFVLLFVSWLFLV